MATSDSPSPPPALLANASESPTVRLLRQKVWGRMSVKNQHFMGVIVGREGFGKSHSALSIARAVDPGFSAEDVYFDPKGLLEAFQSDDYGTGDMIVLDEAGVGLGKRTWYEKSQVLLNQTLQTVRDDNMGVLFTLPRLSELDSQTIGRLHAFLEMTDVVKDDGYALAKWKNVDPSRGDRAKNYYKYSELRFDGVPYDVQRVKIGQPPADLAEEYEQRKEAFKDELYKEAIEAQEDEEDNKQSPQEIVDEISDESLDAVVRPHGRTGDPIVDKDLARATFELSHADARSVKSMIEQQYSEQELADCI